MKKFLQLIGSLLIPLFLAFDKYGFSDYLKSNYSKTTGDIVWWGLLGVSVLTVFGTWKISKYNPEKKYEKAQMVRKLYLKDISNRTIEKFNEKKYSKIASVAYNEKTNKAEINFNVMRVKRRWYGYLDPNKKGKGRFFLLPRTFKDVWTSDGHFISENFILGIRQGTTGIANRTTDLAQFSFYKATQEEAQKELNLNTQQFNDSKSVSILMSKAIFHKDEEERGKEQNVVKLGVLTMEIKSEALGILMGLKQKDLDDNSALKDAYDESLTFLSSILDELASEYSKLYF